MLQEKDILLHAIDNTEDVLLHRAWSEEAKQRVREARRAGRKVSEMFANLYNSSGRYIYKTGRATKRFANAVDSKYNISEHNGKTNAMFKSANRYARTLRSTVIVTLTRTLETLLENQLQLLHDNITHSKANLNEQYLLPDGY